MRSSAREKVLIAVDGSEKALQALRYAASILDPERFEVVLFHVLTRVPESFIDLDAMPAYQYRIVSVEAWERQQEKILGGFLEEARAVLAEAGFPDGAVRTKVEDRKVGIARDVATECRDGYRAVVIGRKGLSELKDFMLGSIANKILELVPIPIWVVGGAQRAGKILMCMDNSQGSMRAVDHLGAVLDGRADCTVMLYHVVRGFSRFRKFIHGVFASEEDPKIIETIERELSEAEKLLEPAFDAARAKLLAAGMQPERIGQKVVSGASNSANCIIEEAEKGEYDTIVVGRRGISQVEEFLMGRVSNRVIQLAKEKTVWVVS